MNNPKRYLLKKCANCANYQEHRNEYSNGTRKPVIKYENRCIIHGNVNPNELCCKEDFQLKKQCLKELEEYDAVLLAKEGEYLE